MSATLAHDLLRFDKPVPRYTSYPPANLWELHAPHTYPEALEHLSSHPHSLYVHIPFCRKRCLFCGCHVILNRKEEVARNYVDYLLQEIALTARHLGPAPKPAIELHLGGGTPTHLSLHELSRIVTAFQTHFTLLSEAELSIEIDPRTVPSRAYLEELKAIGFNRVSFGVQDFDEKVQRAIGRDQSREVTHNTYAWARAVGFRGINIDLIYGLPLQTEATFQDTILELLSLRPDRISLFSYAKVPWVKPQQKAIREVDLPSAPEKFSLILAAESALVAAGYLPIGMDHFALKEDPLGSAGENLRRNFQGYYVGRARELLGFGVSSISSLQDGYYQNYRDLEPYYAALDSGALPSFRGKRLTEEDHLRKWVIERLMCHFRVSKSAFHDAYGKSFDTHFASELKELPEELAENQLDAIVVTPKGRLLVRLVANCFDEYRGITERFSRSI